MTVINSAQAASLALMLCWACQGVARAAAPPSTGHDRALRIEQGYGLEGGPNEASGTRLTSEILASRFKGDDLHGGIVAGGEKMIRVVDGEALRAPAKPHAVGLGKIWAYGPILFILALFLGGLLREWIGRFPAAIATGTAIAVLAWLFADAVSIGLIAGAIALVITLMNGGIGGIGVGGRRGGLFAGGFGAGGDEGAGGLGGTGGGFSSSGTFGGGGASGGW